MVVIENVVNLIVRGIAAQQHCNDVIVVHFNVARDLR